MEQITVVFDQEEPVYHQIARQLREMVAAGRLPPGFRLPTVRTLARDLGVNLNTIARAYRVLEGEGFIRISGRSGAEVVPPAHAGGEVPEPLRVGLRTLLARLRQAGVDDGELRAVVLREIERLGGPSPRPSA
jgi:DNA-binding transcriptional regulator YhcF (GntR family)